MKILPIYRNIKIENDVKIGKNCVIERNVVIKSGTEIKDNVFIGENTTIGNNNIIYSFSSIGSVTQDYKYSGEPTFLKIGDGNIFREFTSVNRGTNKNSTTIIGNNNKFLSYSHIGHDTVVYDNVNIGCYAALGGYSSIMDNARLSAHSCVTPYCRMGEYSYLAANSKAISDILPYCTAEGNPASLRYLNIWALKKYLEVDKIRQIERIFKIITSEDEPMKKRIEEILKIDPTDSLRISSFIQKSKFGVIDKVKK